MRTRTFAAAYGAIAILDLLGELLDRPLLIYLSKPLIAASLFAYFSGRSRGGPRRFRTMVLAALAFSWLGDVLLMLPGDLFLAGLTAFLLAHACFIVAFTISTGRRGNRLAGALLALPVLGYGLFVYRYLAPTIPTSMRLPVAVYSAALVLTVAASLGRLGRVSRPSFWLVLAGAALFATSDSLIGLRQFRGAFPLDDVAVMATYMAAQLLIVVGCLRQLDPGGARL